jgi:hypothetical protein
VPAPARAGKKFAFKGNGEFLFPEGVWETIPVGTKLRLTADLLLEQGDVRGVNFMLQSMPGKKRPFGSVLTPKGLSDLRYVVEFKHQATKTPYTFVLRQGDRMKMLFRNLALDRLG